MHITYAQALDEFLTGIDQCDTEQFRLMHGEPTEANKIIIDVYYKGIMDGIKKRYSIDEREMLLLGMKLNEDRMVIHDTDYQIFRMTFKGKDFIETGGYTRARRVEKRKHNFNLWLNVFLITGAIATALIAFFEFEKFCAAKKETTQKNYNCTPDTIYKQPAQFPIQPKLIQGIKK